MDASAILRYIENEPGAARVEELLNRGLAGACEIAISPVNWGEVLYVLLRKLGLVSATRIAAQLRALPIMITTAGEAQAEQAAGIKNQYGIPYADCYAAALAQQQRGILVTADYDLKACSPALKIEFLPARSTHSNPSLRF
jgi:predicted nucleic acid-binding protein